MLPSLSCLLVGFIMTLTYAVELNLAHCELGIEPVFSAKEWAGRQLGITNAPSIKSKRELQDGKQGTKDQRLFQLPICSRKWQLSRTGSNMNR